MCKKLKCKQGIVREALSVLAWRSKTLHIWCNTNLLPRRTTHAIRQQHWLAGHPTRGCLVHANFVHHTTLILPTCINGVNTAKGMHSVPPGDSWNVNVSSILVILCEEFSRCGFQYPKTEAFKVRGQ